MAELNLSKYGISGTTEIVHNPSYEMLFAEETKPGLEGYEVGQVSELGAVNVMTGIYTGRSPKDKYIVVDENSKDTVWWTSDAYKNDNHPMSEQVWSTVKEIAVKELCNKRLFVVDAFCGANKDTRMAIRFIMEVAWQAHFVTNMFIRPTEEELAELARQQQISQVTAQIDGLKAQIAASDYKVIKTYEYTLLGEQTEYDMEAVHAERQALRDQINSLETQLADLTAE